MKIVAFLQNPGFLPGTLMSIVERYRTDQEFHRQRLAESMSGARLKVAFGNYWFEQIWWDNANPNIRTLKDEDLEADIPHMERVVMEQKPTIILTFGKQAEAGIMKTASALGTKIYSCHHPNARYRNQAHLDNFAQAVIAEAISQRRI